MDVSLDDYIKKKGGVKTKKLSLAGRLGPKISPQKLKKKPQQQQQNTQFKVTGLGNVKKGVGSSKVLSVFDARIKLGKKDNIKVVKDARQKIGGGNTQGNDLRAKVNNMKARKTDARERITARQHQQTGQQQQQKIVVTGLGRPIPSLVPGPRAGVQIKRPFVKQVGGSLMKTVVTTGQGKKGNKLQPRVRITSGGFKVTTRQQNITDQEWMTHYAPKVQPLFQNQQSLPSQNMTTLGSDYNIQMYNQPQPLMQQQNIMQPKPLMQTPANLQSMQSQRSMEAHSFRQAQPLMQTQPFMQTQHMETELSISPSPEPLMQSHALMNAPSLMKQEPLMQQQPSMQTDSIMVEPQSLMQIQTFSNNQRMSRTVQQNKVTVFSRLGTKVNGKNGQNVGNYGQGTYQSHEYTDNSQNSSQNKDEPVDTTASQQLPGFVKIKNDLYVPPPKPEPIVWHNPQPQQMQQSHQQQIQPQYIEPVRYHYQQPEPVRYQQPVEEMIYQQQPPVQSIQYEEPEPIYITRKQVHNPSPVVTDSGGPYRVMVTNLHPIVTQDDLVELFGSIGALKRARLLKPGLAEILYMKRDDALSACKKYHMRELDGQPMQVNMTSLPKAKPPPSPPAPREHQPLFRHTAPKPLKRISPPRRDDQPPPLESAVGDIEEGAKTTFQPLRLGASDKPGPSRMDMGLVHKALFKTSAPGQPNRPVTFTVKI